MVALLCMLPCCAPKADRLVPDENTRAMPNAVSQPYAVDIDALAALLTPVAADMHWGLGKVDNQITALRATAWTADDRPVEIRAQQTAGGIDVQVKVGHFGDRATEQQFLQALARRVGEQARRHRQGQ